MILRCLDLKNGYPFGRIFRFRIDDWYNGYKYNNLSSIFQNGSATVNDNRRFYVDIL